MRTPVTRIGILSAIVLGAVLLGGGSADAAAACTGPQQTISFANWAAAETATAKEVNASIAAFEQANPCIEVKLIAIPFAEMVSQLTVMTIGGNTPDVMELSSGMPQALAAQGALADLRKDAAPIISDIQPAILQDGEYQGKLVALPLSLTPHGFWFNKALMKQAGLDPSKPPETIDEMTHDMAIIKAKLPKVYPFAMMTAKGAYAVVNMWPWLQAFCKTPPMSGGHLGWAQPCAVQAFTWFQKMAKQGWMPVGNNMKDNRQLFATGQVAFTIDGPYMRGIVGSINPKFAGNADFADTFAAAKVPVGPSGESRTAIDIHQIGMGAHSAREAAAWKFVQFMVSSPDDMRDFIIPEGGLPPLVSLQKQFSSALDQPYQQAWINEIIPEARPIPYDPNWFHASDFMVNALQKVVNGGDVKSALSDLENQLKRLYPHDQS